MFTARVFFTKILFFAWMIALQATTVLGDIPKLINYQGRLSDSAGDPVADGNYMMRFLISDAAVGGTLLWNSGAHFMAVNDGVFSVLLGESPQPPIDLQFQEDYWLEIRVSGDIQSPRVRLGSIGYAYMASGLVPGTEVSASLATPPYAMIVGHNLATAGYALGAMFRSESDGGTGVEAYGGVGIHGGTSSTLGIGVRGEASGSTGSASGVAGASYQASGKGVYGHALSTTGSNYGVYGASSSDGGIGVYGEATATTGFTQGGSFKSDSESGTGASGYGQVGIHGGTSSTLGIGVRGEASGSTGSASGVAGASYQASGRGVYGHALSTIGENYGVYGASSSDGGIGVYGEATATTGFTQGGSFKSDSESGTGASGYGQVGIHGGTSSTLGIGVRGEASGSTGSASGVAGASYQESGRGVYGHALSTTGENYGVYGQSESTGGVGVYGLADATSGQTEGVYGINKSTEGRGVVGWAQATTGTTRGVYGRSDSPSGHGVYYSGGLGGTGLMRSVVGTSRGPTGLSLHTATEDWVEDFGGGQLMAGRARINLDPLYLETVTIDNDNPMRVSVQPAGDCHGVYVRKDLTGFDVIELGNGHSNASFDYRVVAKRRGSERKRLERIAAAIGDPYLFPHDP